MNTTQERLNIENTHEIHEKLTVTGIVVSVYNMRVNPHGVIGFPCNLSSNIVPSVRSEVISHYVL